MNLAESVKQMNYVEGIIAKLPAAGAFAFALACTERQWPVFERASTEILWMTSRRTNFRGALDRAWECLAGEGAIPTSVIHKCEEDVLPLEEVVGAPSVTTNTIANSIVDLLHAIQSQESSYPHNLSGRNLGLLEILEENYGETHKKEREKILAELKAEEIQRQNHDLDLLSIDSMPSGIGLVRRLNTQRSLFDGHWFER